MLSSLKQESVIYKWSYTQRSKEKDTAAQGIDCTNANTKPVTTIGLTTRNPNAKPVPIISKCGWFLIISAGER